MKTIYKAILFLLAVCMLLVPLAGCSSDKNDKDKTQPIGGNNNGAPSDNSGNAENVLPPHKTYDDTTVTIFAWNAFATDYVLNEEVASVNKITQALWERDLTVGEHLGVNIQYITQDGHYAAMGTFLNTLEASITVGDALFDLVQQYSLTAAIATMRGLYLDIAQNPEVNLTDAPYWPSDIKSSIAHNNKLYFITGDIASTVLQLAVILAYNEEMIEDLQLEHPYDLYKNNEWTWEKFFEMCKGVYADQGDQGVDNDDRYAYVPDGVMWDVAYHSIGQRLVERDVDNRLVVSEDVRDDKTITFAGQMKDFFASQDVIKPIGPIDETFNPFIDGNILFYTCYMSQNFIDFFDWGAMPPPKYNAEQERYYTLTNLNISIFSVPYDTPSFEVSGAVLEYLAMEAYRTVTPALFEQTYKATFAQAPEDAEMFDVIRSSITWDFGRIYGETLGGLYSAFRKVVNGYDAGSFLKGAAETAEIKLEDIVATLDALKR